MPVARAGPRLKPSEFRALLIFVSVVGRKLVRLEY